MKKLLILLLLFATPIYAGQYLSTFSSVRAEARRLLNSDPTGTAFVSDTTANQFIRLGIVTVNPLVRGDKSLDTIITAQNQSTYAFDTLLMGIMSVEWISGAKTKPLQYLPRGLWTTATNADSLLGKSGPSAVPSYYDFTDSLLFVYPTPARASDTLELVGFQRVGDIDTLTTLTFMPEAYRVAVLNYVVYRIAMAKQHPLVELYAQEFMRSATNLNVTLNNAKVSDK